MTGCWGNLIDRMSFDPWGQRQYADWADGNPTGGDPDYYPTTNGYTGHEMLDQEQLIHMNGRVCDPVIGRFLSPDLLISAPYNSQSFNRYSYVLNNPLSLMDPSGYNPNNPCPDCSDNIISHAHQDQPPCQATTCYNDSDAEAFRDQMVMQSYNGWGSSGIYFQDSTAQYFAQQADPFQNVTLNVDVTQGNGEQNSNQEETCRPPMKCSVEQPDYLAPHEDPVNVVGFISTIAGLSLATEKTVMTASGKRIPRLPLSYGMDIGSYNKAITASRWFGFAGKILGIGSYFINGKAYFDSAESGDYRSARKYGTDAFYGTLMMAPPYVVTIPIGVVGLYMNHSYHGDPHNP